MSKQTKSLFNFHLHEDEDGVHIDLSGPLAKDFKTLVDSCTKYCCSALSCCTPSGNKDKDAKDSCC